MGSGEIRAPAWERQYAMHTGTDVSARTIVPTLRYRDVAAAIQWLCGALGFERRAVVSGADGCVRYAELTFGDGMIMVGPVEGSAVGSLMTQPDQVGGLETQICYLFVDDAADHCAKAVAAGAEILLDIQDERSGRGYSCRDPEGHIWNFGTYNPWRRQAEKPSFGGFRCAVDGALRCLALSIGFLAITFAAVGIVAWGLALVDPHAVAASIQLLNGVEAPERALKEARGPLQQGRAARERAQRAAREVAEQVRQKEGGVRLEVQEAARDRAAVEGAQRMVRETRAQRVLLQRTAAQSRELDTERASRLDAERGSKQAREQLARERTGREAAERANRLLRKQLARQRSAIRALLRRRAAAQSSAPLAWQ
jgi:uncharacterized glyoxalase superfamily protein PhnB